MSVGCGFWSRMKNSQFGGRVLPGAPRRRSCFARDTRNLSSVSTVDRPPSRWHGQVSRQSSAVPCAVCGVLSRVTISAEKPEAPGEFARARESPPSWRPVARARSRVRHAPIANRRDQLAEIRQRGTDGRSAKMCGGFTCSKNALTALNILYIVSKLPAPEDSIPARRPMSCILASSDLYRWERLLSIGTFLSLPPPPSSSVPLHPSVFTGPRHPLHNYASRSRVYADWLETPPPSPPPLSLSLSLSLPRVFFPGIVTYARKLDPLWSY